MKAFNIDNLLNFEKDSDDLILFFNIIKINLLKNNYVVWSGIWPSVHTHSSSGQGWAKYQKKKVSTYSRKFNPIQFHVVHTFYLAPSHNIELKVLLL